MILISIIFSIPYKKFKHRLKPSLGIYTIVEKECKSITLCETNKSWLAVPLDKRYRLRNNDNNKTPQEQAPQHDIRGSVSLDWDLSQAAVGQVPQVAAEVPQGSSVEGGG